MNAQPRPLHLVAELEVHDREKLLRYAAKVQPVMARYGGRILGLSVGDGVRTLEGDWGGRVIVVHEWATEEGFEAFWRSDEYAPLRELRHEACDSRIVVFPALAPEVARRASG